MLILEILENTIPPVPPEKARLNALKRQKQNITKSIKATKAQAKIAQGQRQLSAALKS
jgi:hypothetical protein